MATLTSLESFCRVDEFHEFMVLKNFSSRTVKVYIQIVKQFIQWWQTHHSDKLLRDDIVRKCLLYRFELGRDWQTVNSDYSGLQKWFNSKRLFIQDLTQSPRNIGHMSFQIPSIPLQWQLFLCADTMKTDPFCRKILHFLSRYTSIVSFQFICLILVLINLL